MITVTPSIGPTLITDVAVTNLDDSTTPGPDDPVDA